jgi:hypothetical protein
MKRYTCILAVMSIVLAFAFLPGCSDDPVKDLYGTWTGKTRIDQDMTITIRQDRTIEIETQVDSVRQIRKGTYTIIDRRLRIALTTLDTYTGNVVKRETKADQDEALFTFTSRNEMVLRKGTQAIILQRAEAPG